jgi:uncharacterized Zn finger protein (UPF0148 family)
MTFKSGDEFFGTDFGKPEVFVECACVVRPDVYGGWHLGPRGEILCNVCGCKRVNKKKEETKPQIPIPVDVKKEVRKEIEKKLLELLMHFPPVEPPLITMQSFCFGLAERETEESKKETAEYHGKLEMRELWINKILEMVRKMKDEA